MSQAGLIEVYITFDNNCLEAFHFYAELLGDEITSTMKYSEMPAPEAGGAEDLPKMSDDLVMHASIKIGNTTLMGSDNPYGDTTFGDSICLTWSHASPDEVNRVWDGFVQAGSEITMPIEESFFSPLFGQVKDPYGVHWQIMVWDDSANY